MASSADDEKHSLLAQTADCKTLNDVGATIIKPQFLLGELSVRNTHFITTTIRFMGRNTADTADELKTVRFGEKFDVYGPMLTPVIKEISAHVDSTGDGVAFVITPNDNENDSKLLNDAISKVEITANDEDENTFVFEQPHATDGIYKIVDTAKLILGKTYYFSCQMISIKADLSPMSESKKFKIVDTISPETGKLSIVANDGVDANLVIASHTYSDVTGVSEAAKESHRAKSCVLRYAVVPANIIDQTGYSQLTYQTKEFVMNPYDAVTGKMTLPRCELLIPNCRGLTVVGQYAIRNPNGLGEWSTAVRELVPAATPAAPKLVISESAGKFTVESEISQSTQGLVLIGYEFVVVNKDDVATDLGEWTLDSKEVIIAGDKATATVTAASFNGIVGLGEKVLPAVAQRSVKAVYKHSGALALTPYFKLRSRGVYGNAADFALTPFTNVETSYARGDLANVFAPDTGTLTSQALKINGSTWYDMFTKTEIYGEWATSELNRAKVTLAASTVTTPSFAAKDGELYAAYSITALAAHNTFAKDYNGDLAYYIRNKKVSGSKQYLKYDRHTQTYIGEFEVPQGENHEIVLGAEVFSGEEVIGEAVEVDVTGYQTISGPNRKAVSGRYSAHLAALASTTDSVLEHTAVQAAFAIESSGKLSEDHDLSHRDNTGFSAAFTMSNFESYNDATGKWAAATLTATAHSGTLKKYTEAEGKLDAKLDTTKEYAVIKVTGHAALTRYRCDLLCHFAHTTPANNYIDRLPRKVEFVATESFAAPVLTAVGVEGAVVANFSAPATGDLSEAHKKSIDALGGVSNDVYLNAAKVAAKTSAEEEFTVAASGTAARVEGARSYVNPNTKINNGLVLVDAARVSSSRTVVQTVNVEIGPDAAEGVSVSTVMTGTTGSQVANLRIMRKKSDVEASTSFHVRVASEDDSVDNLDKLYAPALLAWSNTSPVSDCVQVDILHSTLTGAGALNLSTDKKFMTANLKVSVIASTGSTISSSTRQSAPVVVSYSPKMVPALAASDFTVERLPSTLRVSLKDLTADKLGGFATLPVKIRAKHSANTKIVYGDTQNDIITLGSNLTVDFGAMVSGLYTVECEILDIEGEDFKVAKTISVGTFTPGSALVAAKKFKVARKVGTLATDAKSLIASWEAADLLTGWGTPAYALYVTGEDAAGKTVWYYQPADLAATTTVNESLVNALSIASVETPHGAAITTTAGISSATIDRLTVGQKYTVTLQSTFTKTGETSQVVRVSDYDVPSIAPEFTDLRWDSGNGILTAYITNNGSAIKQFMLLARYSPEKPLGKVLMNVSLDGLDSIDAVAGSVVRYLISFDLTKPIPSGILAILMNDNGVDAHADPDATFGVGEKKKSPIYTANEIAAMKTFKTSAK